MLIDFILTAVGYLLVPFIFWMKANANNQKYTLGTIKKIVIINGICAWVLFRIITLEMTGEVTTGAAVFLWSAVAYWLLKKYCLIEESAQESAETSSPAEQNFTGNVKCEAVFCRKCGSKLLDGSQFCHECGTKSMVETTLEEPHIKAPQITPIEKLALLTISLPVIIADKSEEEINIVKNQYAFCDAIIFVEFFIRANALELAPSRDVAIKFSDAYIDAVIRETENAVPDAEPFFYDMFHRRARLYDSIVMNSKEPVMDVVEVLTHIIHEEIDNDKYVMTLDKNYRYFGGIFENLAIKTELVSLFQCIHDVTGDTLEELKNYLKTLTLN